MAYGAVANGGNLMRPLIVRALRAADGTILEHWEPEVVRPALRPAVAGQMRELLRGVVTDGTGKKAEIKGLDPAGKTSTAQKFIPEEGMYSTRHYIASFIGFAPYQDPQVLCLVLLNEPAGDYYGGSVAAPVFKEVVSDAFAVLSGSGVIPSDALVRVVDSEQDPRREVPSVEGLSASMGFRVLREAGFLPRPEGTGARVVASDPPAGELLLPGTVVTLRLSAEEVAARPDSSGNQTAQMEAPEALRPMPDLRGLCLRDALLRARSAGIQARATGAGWVSLQTPEPGTEIDPGQPCTLTLGPDSCRAYKEYLISERLTAWEAGARDLNAGATH
jgi:stage V sporulation protein D (sporulation-specific penicillin-binding protein)